MARPGQTLENPLTRERCTWLLTAQETGGRLSRAEWRVRPSGAAPALHVHGRGEERFALRSGRMGSRSAAAAPSRSPGASPATAPRALSLPGDALPSRRWTSAPWPSA